MKKMLLTGIAVGIFLTATTGMLQATTILQASAVWTDGASYYAPIENVINQSGLYANYTSEVDEFYSFVNGTGSSYSDGVINTLGDTSAPTDNYYFDLGAVYDVEALAIWNQSGTASLNTFNIFAATDSSFSNTTLLGNFSIADGAQDPGNIYTFGNTSTQYLMIDVLSNYGFSYATRLNEVAFGVNTAPVPEPATMLLFGTGLIGLVGSRVRKKKK